MSFRKEVNLIIYLAYFWIDKIESENSHLQVGIKMSVMKKVFFSTKTWLTNNKINLISSHSFMSKLRITELNSRVIFFISSRNLYLKHSRGRQFFAVNIRLHNKAIKINFVHVLALNIKQHQTNILEYQIANCE